MDGVFFYEMFYYNCLLLEYEIIIHYDHLYINLMWRLYNYYHTGVKVFEKFYMIKV